MGWCSGIIVKILGIKKYLNLKMRVGLITPLLCRHTDRSNLVGDYMTIGIYRLCFNGTDQCYIGQSINIEKRYEQHLTSFVNNKANPKMMHAYTTYGNPFLEVLCECNVEELNAAEDEAIELFDSVANGLNLLEHAGAPLYHGENHSRCKYSNKQLIEAARLLTNPLNKAKDISEITGVAVGTVQDIASLTVHGWLATAEPETYQKLVVLRGKRKNPKGIADRGITYPPVQAPDGTIYTNIFNLSKFCEEHGLSRSNFRKVLQRKNKSSLGWRLVNHG